MIFSIVSKLILTFSAKHVAGRLRLKQSYHISIKKALEILAVKSIPTQYQKRLILKKIIFGTKINSCMILKSFNAKITLI